MTRSWYIIDQTGWRRIDVDAHQKGEKRWDFWSGFRNRPGQSAPWPGFLQLAVGASSDRVRAAIVDFASSSKLSWSNVGEQPERWDEAVLVGEDPTALTPPITLISQPVDAPEMGLINAESVDDFFYQLGVDGAFYGHDADSGTLMISVYRSGQPEFSWQDSLEPGPSWALSFHADGRASVENPRPFALRRLGLPATSPFLDRYAFIEHELRALGVQQIAPLMANRPIVAAFLVEPEAESDNEKTPHLKLRL